jgi:hypothetical protein
MEWALISRTFHKYKFMIRHRCQWSNAITVHVSHPYIKRPASSVNGAAAANLLAPFPAISRASVVTFVPNHQFTLLFFRAPLPLSSMITLDNRKTRLYLTKRLERPGFAYIW